jgi:hypothetical protein
MTMSSNNGKTNGTSSSQETRMGSMEVESFHDEQQQQQQQRQQPFSPLYFLQALWALILAYANYYRGISACLLSGFFILFMVIMMNSLASLHHAKIHHLTHDYSSIPSLYEVKMAQIDHWCLQVRVCLGIDILHITMNLPYTCK